MTFAEDLIADLDDFLSTDEFARTGAYNGVPVTLDLQTAAQDLGGDRTAKPGILRVRESDVPAPAVNDPVVVDGVTWVVVGVPAEASGGLWTLQVQTDERPVI